jgi:hypothetical protein
MGAVAIPEEAAMPAADDTSVLPALSAARAPASRVPVLVAAAVAVGGLAAASWFYVQAGSLQESLANAEARVAEASKATANARRELKAAQALVAERDAELAKFREAPLPVDVTFRAGRPGTGFIAQLDNRSAEAMVVDVTMARPGTGETTTVQLEIAARGLGELGPGHGWTFASGDTLRVSGGSYRALTLRVP